MTTLWYAMQIINQCIGKEIKWYMQCVETCIFDHPI